MNRNEKFNNCQNNTKNAKSQTFNSFFERVNKIADELETKSHKYQDLYSNLYNETPTIHLEINPDTGKVDKLYNPNIPAVKEINWCDTCESTTLNDCLECINGNKNPNWKPNNETNTDEVNNTEKHFLETVKKAKTEDLEKVYNTVVRELRSRYLDMKENTNCSCDNCSSDCNCECHDDKLLKESPKNDKNNSIKGTLYYRKNDGEPLEIKVELSENDIKEMKKDMEEEINKAFNNMIKNFGISNKYFRF